MGIKKSQRILAFSGARHPRLLGVYPARHCRTARNKPAWYILRLTGLLQCNCIYRWCHGNRIIAELAEMWHVPKLRYLFALFVLVDSGITLIIEMGILNCNVSALDSRDGPLAWLQMTYLTRQALLPISLKLNCKSATYNSLISEALIGNVYLSYLPWSLWRQSQPCF